MADDDNFKEVKLIYPDSSDEDSAVSAENPEEKISSENEIPDDTENETYTSTDPYSDPYSSEEIESSENSEQIQYEPTQDTLINQSEASEKNNPGEIQDQEKNKGTFFDRTKVLYVLGISFIVAIFAFVFILPLVKKNNVKKEHKMPQATKTWNNVDDWLEPPKEEEEEDTGPHNSADITQEEEEIPPLVIEEVNHDEFSDDSGKPSRPETNRNEQQKSISRLTLDDYTRTNYDNVKLNRSGNNSQNSGYQGFNNPNAQYTGGSANAYMPQALSNNLSKYAASFGNNYEKQNDQDGKEEFYNSGGLGGNYNWNSEYTLWKGTIIPAVLETGINTDLPGVVIATVTTNVYSSLDGKHLLIPQGSKLFAEYSSSISYGQNRVQVIWNTLIRPDGLEVNLGGLNGVDPQGRSGYTGFKSIHPFEYLKAMGLIACFSLLDTKLNNVIAGSTNAYTQNLLTDTYSETKKLNNKIVERALDIQPTIRIANGTKVDLITNVSMELPPLDSFPVEKRYIRK